MTPAQFTVLTHVMRINRILFWMLRDHCPGGIDCDACEIGFREAARRDWARLHPEFASQN